MALYVRTKPKIGLPDPVLNKIENEAIDAVVTWVDGHAPSHRALRAKYMAQNGAPLSENASNPHRWESSDEIYFCLLSIYNHAPWVRHIWIVVDHEAPDFSRLPKALRDKLRIVRHEEVFAGYTDVLPTFNSLAIESMLWRIDGLSERFMYFNDDVFLTAPLKPEDIFAGARPVLRGQWRNYAALVADRSAQDDPAMFNHVVQVNAAALCGFGPARVFAAAHVVHPMRRGIMAQQFDRHRAAFEGNIAARFRKLEQFLPQGLHNHACIADGRAVFAPIADYLHIKSGQGASDAPEITRALLLGDALAQTRFLCVNDLPQLEALVPDARSLIEEAIGGSML